MPTKIELQKKLLEQQALLVSAKSSLKILSKNKSGIDNAVVNINKISENLEGKAKNIVLERKIESEKKSADAVKEIKNTTDKIKTLGDDIKRLEELIKLSPDKIEDPYFFVTRQVGELNDRYPILLFPVRLETRFIKSGNNYELWIRVYPDSCQTEVDRNYLLSAELDSAIAYIADAAYNFEGKHTNNRVSFIKNWINDNKAKPAFLDTIKSRDKLKIKNDFVVDIVDQIPLPIAKTIPEKFVFRLVSKDGTIIKNMVGKNIINPLFLGFNKENNIGVEWLENFDKAIEAGMGIKVQLTKNEYETGFSKLIALGIKSSTDHISSHKLLENLFTNHYYSNGGFSFIKQGTPTNNSDNEASGYSWKNKWEINPAEPFTKVHNVSNQTEESIAGLNDGEMLSQFLGIDDSLFQNAENGRGTDQKEAKAMNAALFPATLGYYLDEMMDPLISDAEIKKVEDFFVRYVSGRGTLPAIRIGKQPYGILPISAIERFELEDSELVRNKICDLVKHLYNIWKDKSKSVKHINSSETISTDDFLSILSLHPNSVNFNQRIFEDISAKVNAVNSTLINQTIIQNINEWLEEQYFQVTGNSILFSQFGIGSQTSRPDILYKIFSEDSTTLNGPIIEESLQEYDLKLKEVFSETEGLKDNYIKWLLLNDFDSVRTEKGIKAKKKPLLYLLLRHSFMLRYAQTAIFLKQISYNEPIEKTKANYKDNQIVDSVEKTKMVLMYQQDKKITNSNTLDVQSYIHNEVNNKNTSILEIKKLQEYKKILSQISELPTARLERAFVEHIDCCTYRLDAWINGLFSLQLRKQRFQNDKKWSKGIYLGAFGYLEDIKPKLSQPSEGYIIAPSIAHAATGAILKNAQLTYSGNDVNPYKINISSERVKLAKQLLEGMQNGQGLPELLGYRFERYLHDNNIDKFILDFRKKYPLVEELSKDNNVISETIKSTNVVHGLRLINDYSDKGESIFNTIGMPTALEKKILNNALDYLQNIFDALKDIMMAESVYQTMHGNFDRGSAILDSLSHGKFPPEPEVIQTPRSGAILTHKVALHFKFVEIASGTNSLRAMLEPSVNEWLKNILPNFKEITFCIEDIVKKVKQFKSLQDLNISPIDLLYLLNFDQTKSMTALDDLIYSYAVKKLGTTRINIHYKEKRKKSEFTFFELSPVLRHVNKILFQSKSLSQNDLLYRTDNENSYYNIITEAHKKRLNSYIKKVSETDLSLLDSIDHKTSQEVFDKLVDISIKVNSFINNEMSFGIVLDKLLNADISVDELSNLKIEVKALIKSVKEKRATQIDELSAIIKKISSEFIRRSNPVNNNEKPYFYDNLMNDLKNILGGDILMLPYYNILNDDNVTNSFADSGKQLEFAKNDLKMDFPVEEWLNGTACVREKVFSAVEILNFVNITKGREMELIPLQLPYSEKERWLAVQFAKQDENIIAKDKLLYTIISSHKHTEKDTVCGFLVDEWTEAIPNSEETAGLSFHYNRPNAEAPQTMLLVTPPVLSGSWYYEDIMDSVTSAIEIAKTRAVEPDSLDDTALAQFLPAAVMFSPLYDTFVTTNLLNNVVLK